MGKLTIAFEERNHYICQEKHELTDMEFKSQTIGHSHSHRHDAPQKMEEWFVWKTKMYGSDTDWSRIIALHMQKSILLARNVSHAGIGTRPDQKDDPLSLALYIFGS